MDPLTDYYEIENFIDKDAPGSSAHVAQAIQWRADGSEVAFKVMRLAKLENEGVWQQFETEVYLLDLLKDQSPVVKMADCGFVSDLSQDLPRSGEILSCGCDPLLFQKENKTAARRSLRPYIALEQLPARHSLLNMVLGSDGTRGRPLRLPTVEGLNLARQFASFLKTAHERNVVYIDHKPEHTYWDGATLRIIDLNVSCQIGAERSAEEKASKKVDDLRKWTAGVLYPAFTGRDALSAEGPVARPSDPASSASRFNDLDYLDFGMEPTLLADLVLLMNQIFKGETGLTIDAVIQGLNQCAAKLGCEDSGLTITNEARRARMKLDEGLARLRQAQALIFEAREQFLAANRLNFLDEDARRLYQKSSEFLKYRVLP